MKQICVIGVGYVGLVTAAGTSTELWPAAGLCSAGQVLARNQ